MCTDRGHERRRGGGAAGRGIPIVRAPGRTVIGSPAASTERRRREPAAPGRDEAADERHRLRPARARRHAAAGGGPGRRDGHLPRRRSGDDPGPGGAGPGQRPPRPRRDRALQRALEHLRPRRARGRAGDQRGPAHADRLPGLPADPRGGGGRPGRRAGDERPGRGDRRRLPRHGGGGRRCRPPTPANGASTRPTSASTRP